MDATLAALVRLHDAQSVTSALDDSQNQSRDTADQLSKAYVIVAAAARDGDRLKNALRETLAKDRTVGRSAYSTELSFYSLLQAVFWALGAPQDSQEGEKLRAAVFVTALQLLHSMNVASVAQRCTPLLLEELHCLRVKDLVAVASEILRGIQQSLHSQHKGDALAVFYSVELLPQLLLRMSASMTLRLEVSQADGDVSDLSGTQYRKNVLSKLSNLDWPRRFFLQLLKNFRDFSLTQDEERDFCIKIYREARKELNSSSDQVRKLEIFPTVCLSVLQLIGRTHNLLCTRLLTRLLIEKCQQLAVSTSERDVTTSSLNARELRELQSTVLYHVEMALRQWERLGEAIKREYEQRSSQKLSSFDIALVLLVASHSKYEPSMMQLLRRHVVNTYTSKHQGGSDGHHAAISRKSFLSVVQDAQDGNWTPIVHQMIELGFHLIEYRGLKGHHGGEASDGSVDTGNSSEWVDFGVRLLLACFQYHLSVRERVLDRVVNMIIVQSSNCQTYVYVMARIVKRHISELGSALEVRIRECLEYVTQLDPEHANNLLVALSPLLKTQHSLKEFVILVLRKAMFRKDEGSRIIGIKGFALLLCLSSRIFSRSRTLSQLYSQNVTMLSQGMGGVSSIHQGSVTDADIASQEHQHAMAAEDLFRQFSGIFRRALELQTRVRAVLYAELVKVSAECPALQESILKLMFQHYQKYYEANETVQPPLKLDLSLSRKRGIYEEPLQYLLHTMLHCYKEIKREMTDSDDEETMMDDIPASQPIGATQGVVVMQHQFLILFERLKRCELSDFEFDKDATFSSDSELGVTNQRMGFLVMGIVQVAMNWSVSQSESESDLDSLGLQPIWNTLLQYSQVYVWLRQKIRDPEGSQRQLQPTKKRKLAKTKKLDIDKASRTTTTSVGVENQLLCSSFEQSAHLQWATFIAPDTLLRILGFAIAKARHANPTACLTSEEEEFVLLIAEQSMAMLDLIQTKMANDMCRDGKVSKPRQSSDPTQRFQPDDFTQRLSDLFLKLFRIYCNEDMSLILPKGSTTRKRALDDNVQSQERMRSIVRISVRGFTQIVEMWSNRPLEEFEEQMTRALCLNVGGGKEASPDYDLEGEESDSVARVLPPLRKLVDDLLHHEMPNEANCLLDVVQIVCGKISMGLPSSADVFSQHVEWVKELLVVRSGEATPRLLEKCVALVLRPSGSGVFCCAMAEQLAQGLRYFCNSGGDDPDETTMDAPPPVIQYRNLHEKHVLTIANAILGKIDEALADTERHVKTYHSVQRRHSLKFKDDDLSALQQLEDETGSQIFRSETEGGNASRFGVFKSLCKQSFDLAGSICPFVEMSLNNPVVSIRIVRLAGRLYKVLVLLLRDKQRRKDASLPKFLRHLFDRVAGDLSPALLRFIACIHDQSTRSESKKHVSKTTAKSVLGKTKFIPEVVFQLEQFDLIMIKLSKLCKGHDFNVWCKLRSARDFRLNKDQVKRSLNDYNLKKAEGDVQLPDSGSDGEGDDAETTSEVAATADADADDDDANGVVRSEDEYTETVKEDEVCSAMRRGGYGKKCRAEALTEDSDAPELVNDHDGEDDEEDEEGGETASEDDGVDEDLVEDSEATYPALAGNEI